MSPVEETLSQKYGALMNKEQIAEVLNYSNSTSLSNAMTAGRVAIPMARLGRSVARTADVAKFINSRFNGAETND